jgi:hypothetical protein
VGEGHVYVAASGFGLRVIPKSAPYRYRLSAESTGLDVERHDGESWLFASVMPHNGGHQSKLAEGTASLADVLDVAQGPQWNRWWLETSVYRLPLPSGWTAMSTNGPSLFDLWGPDDALIFVQTPSRPPKLSDLRTPDQRILSTAADSYSEWVDLGYVHDGKEWRQRHQLRRFAGANIVMTAQALVDAMPKTIAVQADLVETLNVRGE